MAEVFISYAREDHDRVRPLVDLLIQTNLWSVFWDRYVPPGTSWAEYLVYELRMCECLVVLWSATSTRSTWVLTEADVGLKRNILVPAQLDDAELPLGFRHLQTAQLQNWSGVMNFELMMMTSRITDLVGVSPSSLRTRLPRPAAVMADPSVGTLYRNARAIMALGLTRAYCRPFAHAVADDFSIAMREGRNPDKTRSHLHGVIRAYFELPRQDVAFTSKAVQAMRARFLECQTPDDFYALVEQLDEELKHS